MSLDIERAQADTEAIVRELNGFCEMPRVPPSADAVRLCKLAEEVPDCAGFVKQCDDLFKRPEPSEPVSGFWGDLARFIANVAPFIGWAVLILGVLTLLYFIGAAIWRRMKKEPEPELAPASAKVTVIAPLAAAPVETGTPESILGRAEAALARGDLHAALFGFLHAALRALDVRGAIRITRDRTNGEYVRSCADEWARPELRTIVREVDVVQFGGRSPELDRVRDAGRRAAMLVRGAVAMIVLLSLGLIGCKQNPMTKASDPAGFDVAKELLAKQGFVLKRPESSLARLEPPTASEKAPTAILIDVSKTMLDEDANAGLERWVRGGGHLVVFGPVWAWPTAFKASPVFTTTRDVDIDATAIKLDCDEASDECEAKAAEALARMGAREPRPARLATGVAFKWANQDGRTIAAHRDGGAAYASIGDFGSGWVLGVASSDLLTNVGLKRKGNPAALIALLSHLDTQEIVHVDAYGGITGPSNPLAALLKAGLGLPIGHAVAFVVLLALAVGARSRAPRRAPPATRRAFVEHVEATAALYAHAKAAPHALASYGRFVLERLRTRVSKGGDVVSTLAHRAGATKEDVQRVLDRAQHVKAGDQKRGDELAVLRELCDLYARSEAPNSVASSSSSTRRSSGFLRFVRRR